MRSFAGVGFSFAARTNSAAGLGIVLKYNLHILLKITTTSDREKGSHMVLR